MIKSVSAPTLYTHSISQVEPIVNETSLYNTLAKAEEKLLDSRDLRRKLKSFYFSIGKTQTALAVENCGTFLMFKQYADKDHTTKLDKANFCKSPLCPLCAWRRAIKYSAFTDNAISLTRERLYHLVLAIPNVEILTKSELCKLKAKAVYFLKYNMNVTSYISNLEITKSDKGFHPHLHIIFESNAFISVDAEYIKKQAKAWKNCYNKTDTNYDAYTFYLQGVNRDNSGLAQELTKYVLKAETKISADDISIVACAIHGVRRMSSGGNFKKLLSLSKKQYEKNALDELSQLSYYDYEYLIFNYINGKYIQH